MAKCLNLASNEVLQFCQLTTYGVNVANGEWINLWQEPGCSAAVEVKTISNILDYYNSLQFEWNTKLKNYNKLFRDLPD